MQELQQAMHFFPPKKLVAMWLNSGVLTGEKPERMRRRKFMPETGKPPEPGEGYEVVADDDYGSDNEVVWHLQHFCFYARVSICAFVE